jgi:hypothetical protein
LAERHADRAWAILEGYSPDTLGEPPIGVQ